MKHIVCKLLFFSFFVNFVLGTPTEIREWKTTSGHTTSASAIKVENGKVHLKKVNGSVVKVSVNLFVAADQELLRKHFEEAGNQGDENAKNQEAPSGSDATSAEGLPHPVGQLSGPIDANGSKYYVYIPKTLKKGRKASLLFYTHSGGGGNGKLIKELADGAETLGWIMAISVESKNGSKESGKHIANAFNHIMKTLPIGEDRIHYCGNSGGAAQAFYNTDMYKAFGVMPNVGYIPGGLKEKTKVIYGLGGGNDYNRYLTAYAVDKYKKHGFHRMSPKGHGVGPSDHYIDGMIWMHCKYLEMEKPTAAEKEDFEASILNWMNKLKTTNPKRAYSTACIVRDVYEIAGNNAKLNDALIKELSSDNGNVLYHEGLLEINELSMKYFADLGKNGGSMKKHTNSKAAKAAEKLKEKYGSVNEILEVLSAIMKKTV